jgi:hypothetical protein
MITGFLDNAILHVKLVGLDIRDRIFAYHRQRLADPAFQKSLAHDIPLTRIEPDLHDETLVRLHFSDLPDIICLPEQAGSAFRGVPAHALDPSDPLAHHQWLMAHSILVEWQGTLLLTLPVTWQRLLEVLDTTELSLIAPDRTVSFDTLLAATLFFDQAVVRTPLHAHPLASILRPAPLQQAA